MPWRPASRFQISRYACQSSISGFRCPGRHSLYPVDGDAIDLPSADASFDIELCVWICLQAIWRGGATMTLCPPSERTTDRVWPAFRLVERVRCIRLLWLAFARVTVGLFDLLLAAALYILFLRLQGGSALKHIWWTPQSILVAVIVTAVLVVGRALLDVLSTWFASRQIQGLYKDLLLRLLHGYSEMRWERFVERNRSDLLNQAVHTASEAADFYHRWVELTASTVVVVIMITALVYQSPIAAAGLISLFVLFYALHRSLIGKKLQLASSIQGQSIRSLQSDIADMLSSGKEIRTYRNQQFFGDRIGEQSNRLSDSNLRIVLLPQISRIVADQGVVLLFLCLVLVTQVKHGHTRQLLSLLVFYFALSRRLLPLISQIFFIVGQMEGSYEKIRSVDSELCDCLRNRNATGPAMLPEDGLVLELDHVAYSFHQGVPIFQDANLHLRKGETMVLRGVSGSGKSSLLNVIAGISQPASGTVRVDRSHLAYVPQEIPLLDDTIKNNLLLGLTNKSDAALRKALAAARLEDFVAAQPLGLDAPVGDNGILFSGGERQRLGVARAILRGATLLLLDEATSALDEENERHVLNNLTASGIAIILVTHRAHAQPFASRQFVLQGGRLMVDPSGQPRREEGGSQLERHSDSKVDGLLVVNR